MGKQSNPILPKNPDGSVGYVNTNIDDPAFGQPIYQDQYGGLSYTQPGAAGRSETQVMISRWDGIPKFLSTTQPQQSQAPISGNTGAQQIAQSTGMSTAPSTPTVYATPAPTQPAAQPNAPAPTPAPTPTQTTPTGQNQPATGQPQPTQTTQQPTQQLTPEQLAAQQANQAKLDQLLANPSLTPDQKAAIQAIYGAISANDQSQADRIKAAIAAATEYSDPYFKAQTRMVLDSLDRGFQAIDDDLGYKETSLNNSLQALQRDIASAQGYLSFQQLNEMKALERSYTQAIDTTKEDMAARGFTSSSIRSRKEQLIGDTYGDLRESSRRAFLQKEQNYANQLGDAQTNTAAELARLKELAAAGKTDLTRSAEQQVGSTALSGAGYTGGLGNIGGEIPAAQIRDANSFASQFVF